MRAAPVVTDTAVEALLAEEIHLAAAVLAVVAQVQIGKTVEEYSSAVFFIKKLVWNVSNIFKL